MACCCGPLYAEAVMAQLEMTTIYQSAAPTGEAAPGIERSTAEPVNARDERPLYAPRVPIYPKRAQGPFRRVKWAVMAVTLGIYYLLPWLRWDRGPNLPDQALLLDFANQRLYMFGIEIWAQEFYFITGLLIISALALFLVTAVAGRVWCGYACPQTVWTDLMIAVEHFWQGDRNARMRLAKQRWTFEKIWKMTATHASWLLIGLATGGAFVFYFRDAPTLAMEFVNLEAPFIAWLFVGIFAGTTYVLGGLAREQVCTYMCPWPRIQGAMFDEDSLLVTYRAYRGEPRGAHKKGESWDGRGDCIDCKQCVAVCPMGIDIRDGPQLECIQCALCIDACDAIMEKVGRPKKLIAYDTFRNLDAASSTHVQLKSIEHGQVDLPPKRGATVRVHSDAHCAGHGDRAPMRIIRPRTLLYAGALLLVTVIMFIALSAKTVLDVNVQADRNPLFVQLSDGGIRNSYTVRILNKQHEMRSFSLGIEGLPQASLTVLGADGGGAPGIDVAPDNLRTLKAFVTVPRETARALGNQTEFEFVVRDLADGTATSRETVFRGPDK